ncbi:MAG: phosphatase PAP2 family protein [Paludibacter sp.]|nr:phosphatase PAP2 family protein [Paludibacter sp.]MDD4198428.1 phosphatase PAP2 family protein [Paludibacter sp.]MDD4427140.1 phosphatase PAP2 family protein [Paludibacter sp.]
MRKFTIFILLLSNFFVFSHLVSAQNADVDLLRQVNHAVPRLKPVSVFLSETAIPLNLAVPVAIGSYGLINSNKDFIKDACYIALASAINLGMTVILKESIRRERPGETYPEYITMYKKAIDFAMPSGHTSTCFATATALSLKYPEWYIIVPAYAWATSVGLSRMHLGMHYPTDVLAGAALGAGSAYLSYKLNEWIWNNYDIRGWRIIRK